MKTTIFRPEDNRVVSQATGEPPWQPFDEYEGKALDRVRLVEVIQVAGAEIQLVEIGEGGQFAMHSSPDVAFCQVVRGRGKLGLPDGSEVSYEGPELFVFLPNTLHDWHQIEQDTLLSVCLVRSKTNRP